MPYTLDVFALPNFKEAGLPPKKLCPGYHPYLVACQVAKFHEATPPGSKVLATNY